MPTETSKATRAEDIRDLKREIGGLEREDTREIIFKETSPERRKVTIYNMTNGEPVQIPAYMLTGTLNKVLPNGEPMFTARQERAPEYKMGTTLCFLHANSAERAVLDEIGLNGAICPKATLANRHEKRTHAKNRHSREWAAYQDYIQEEKETAAIKRQDQQLEATLALAGRASIAATGECDICGRDGFKNVGAHKRGAHGESHN